MKDGYKKVPGFWWDFEWHATDTSGPYCVVIDADDPKFPDGVTRLYPKDWDLKEYRVPGDWIGTNAGMMSEDWDPMCLGAQEIIEDLNAGRRNHRKLPARFIPDAAMLARCHKEALKPLDIVVKPA